MQTKKSDWERIESVIKWANMTTNFFARHIGLPRGENLYQIKRGNYGVSLKIADMITTSFPAISKLWLLTGEGDMFAASQMTISSRPLYEMGVEEHIRDIATLEPTSHMVLPPSVDCDFAMIYRGRAMGHTTPTNSILLLKKILPEMIIPGYECVVVTKKFVLLRIVTVDLNTEDDHRYRLVADSSEAYGDVIVETHEIEALYLVKGKILINS